MAYPDLKDTAERKGSGSLLEKVARDIRREDITIQRKLQDGSGVFAYITEDSVVVAKKEPYGKLVSCHVRAVAVAISYDKRLAMYIGENEAYYGFNPEVIKKDGRKNRKGGAEMLNFGIKHGRRLDSDQL